MMKALQGVSMIRESNSSSDRKLFVMYLRTSQERIRALKAGFIDREIEERYCTLNDLTIEHRTWQHVPAFMKAALSSQHSSHLFLVYFTVFLPSF